MIKSCAKFLMAALSLLTVQTVWADPGLFHEVLTQRYLQSKTDLYWTDVQLNPTHAEQFNAPRYKADYGRFYLGREFQNDYQPPAVKDWVYADLSQLELKRRMAFISVAQETGHTQRILAIWSADSHQHLEIAVDYLAMAIIHTYEGEALFEGRASQFKRTVDLGITGDFSDGYGRDFTQFLSWSYSRSWEDEKFWMVREYDVFTKENIDAMAYALPHWVTNQIDRQWVQDHVRLLISLDESQKDYDASGLVLIEHYRYSREMGLNVEAYGFHWVANLTSTQDEDHEAGASMYIEAGAIRSVFSGKIDLYGMYRRNLIRRQVEGMPLTQEERKELLQFGARYFLNRKRNVRATVDLIYSFDQASQGLQLNNSDNGIRLRAGIQYLF